MVLTRDGLKDRLRRREIAPVYVLFGEETNLRDLAAKTISDLSFADGDFRDFNDTTFSLNTPGALGQALGAAQQLPMMASRRVIRVADVRVSATGFRDTITEADEPALSAYLADPSPHSVIIFVADELNGVRKMGKFLREKTVAVDFARLDDRQFAEWARSKFKEAGAEIDEPTLRLFLSRVDPGVRRLGNEIDKLAAAALPNRQITLELIDELVPNSREISNFDLTDPLVAQHRRFDKPLRYDARSAAAFPNALLLDAGPVPVPLHVVSAFMDPKERLSKERAIALQIEAQGAWVWRTEEQMPPFMAAARTC